ncbi:undecaprenyl-phosphate glucose phosphotransferase [Methanobacterium sp. SMA-27]|uniref:undecaprenyl-phosphate glucose phosphotransferase n=1 Tax=Methanobacterium sp. SMA-27 TaxID=1495336 RepID=UPI00064F2256|nr:undecaprenyl-phosphate glucose phosphotransferase [Methanobacterium sp. SMA-27]
MIRENQRLLNILQIILDAVVLTLALYFAWYIRVKTDLLGPGFDVWGIPQYATSLLFIIISYTILNYFFGLYNPQRTDKISSEIKQILKVNVIGMLLLITTLYIIEVSDYSRYILAMFAIFSTMFMTIERVILRNVLRYVRGKGYNVQFILVIGAGELGEKFANKIKKNYYIGYNIIGFLDDNISKGQKIADSEIIGQIKDLERTILTRTVDMAIITLSSRHYELIEDIVNTLEKFGVKAEIVPDFYRYFPAKPYIDMIDDIPVINIRYVPLDNNLNKILKRISDIILAILGIIVTSPILLVTAILVKHSSPGPVIYKQKRVGCNRKEFDIYKFRSMRVQDCEEFKWTKEDDPRKTKIGAFIRRTNIDELPQFFNILKGDMSLIGPRPERPYFVDKFRDEIPKYMIKHHVRPGMTGYAQINGYRGNTSIKKRIDHDIFYVENWNFLLDVKIFFMTFKSFFKNAY